MGSYDICVIGAGLIGSAAAKYCALDGAKTCLIGPPEPNSENFSNEHIYGAWFDEGRISRNLDSDPVWMYLSSESSKRYRKLEEESGIKFFNENGYLLLVDENDDGYLRKVDQTMKSRSINYEVLDKKQLKNKFPCLSVPDGMVGFYEGSLAGAINPRLLVKAQIKLFMANGGEWMKDTAVKVERTEQEKLSYRIYTKSGKTIDASKLLVCAGAFLYHYPILPLSKLDVRYRKTLVSRIQLEPGPLLDTLLASLPSFGFVSHTNWRETMVGTSYSSGGADTMASSGFYGMAPIRYPDGNYYLKIGYNGGGLLPRYLDDADAVNAWYRSAITDANLEIGRQHCLIMQKFVDGLKIKRYEMNTCINLETPTNHPYIDQLEKNLYIVTGGNGYAAKSSDELGRIGSKLTISDGTVWPCDGLDRQDVRALFK